MQPLIDWLMRTAEVIPLELFTFFGSFVEEVVAPIPSPIVMTMTGSIAAAQQTTIPYLLVLSVIGAVGKTLGAVLVYVIADRAEDFLFTRFGKILKISHTEIEQFGAKFSGSVRDYLLLFFLRALPVMSTALVSVASGIIALPLRVYIVGTFFGTIVRDFFYLYVGFTGIAALHAMVEGFDSIESLIQILAGVCILLGFGWIYWRRRIQNVKTSL